MRRNTPEGYSDLHGLLRHLQAQLARELDRLELVLEQLVAAERRALLMAAGDDDQPEERRFAVRREARL